nr:MAG TPA: hypothetical protein [Caudoviricetes sp.]
MENLMLVLYIFMSSLPDSDVYESVLWLWKIRTI